MGNRLKREERLLKACRLLFGNEIEISQEFLAYIQEKGVTSAFKKRAMEVHPDRTLASGLPVTKCRKEFAALQIAYETLLQHITSREFHSRATASPQKTSSQIHFHPSGLPANKLLFGRFLYRMGIIEWRQLIMALTWQKSGRPKIGELGVKMGYLDRNSVLMILKNQSKTNLFGVRAYEMGVLTRDEVRDLLQRQKLQEKRIGLFFIEQGLLNSMQLQELLQQCKQHNRWVESITDR